MNMTSRVAMFGKMVTLLISGRLSERRTSIVVIGLKNEQIVRNRRNFSEIGHITIFLPTNISLSAENCY